MLWPKADHEVSGQVASRSWISLPGLRGAGAGGGLNGLKRREKLDVGLEDIVATIVTIESIVTYIY